MARESVLRSKAYFVPALLVAVLVAVLVIAGGIVAGPASAAGSTRYVAPNGVDTDNDCTDQANPCQTIQYATDQANDGDTVSIATGTYAESVRIRKSLTLLGSGATGSGRTTISGSGSDPSIFVDGFDTVSVPRVTVKYVSVSGNQADSGISVYAGSLTVIGSAVSNNFDSGIVVEGPSRAKVTRTTLDGNGQNGLLLEAVDGESAPPTVRVGLSTVSRNWHGGVVIEAGAGHVTNSTLDRNVGAGMVSDGAATSGSLTTSTVSNTVPFTAGGSDPYGGGVLVFPGGGVTIDTSTIYGNTGQGVLADSGAVTMDNSTVSGTHPAATGSAFPAGGIVAVASAQTALAVTGTIVAHNTSISDCVGVVTDHGYNLDSDGSCAWTHAGSINRGKARLGRLADNGGPTKTLRPTKGSDAIDAIPKGSARCSTKAKDQRGVSRPQGRRCDIGAFEVVVKVSQSITVTSSPPGSPRVGHSYKPTATASSGLPVKYSIDSATTHAACTLSAGVVHFKHAGSCVVDFDQAGNSTYRAAPRVHQTMAVRSRVSNAGQDLLIRGR